MYYYLYKKQINIILISIMIAIFGGYVFYYNINPIKNLNLTLNWSVISYNEKEIIFKNYDYYQVYLYPEVYSIDCNSKIDWLCDNLLKNKQFFSNYSIWFYWRWLEKWNFWIINIESDLNKDKIDENIKLIFNSLLNWKKDNNLKVDKWEYNKYFSFKWLSWNSLDLNDMEIMCLNQIKQTVPIWSFDKENIIKERVKSECEWFWNKSYLDIAYWWYMNEEEKNYVNINFNINKIKVDYKFYKKDWDNFKLLSNNYQIIDSNFKINKKIDIKQLLN